MRAGLALSSTAVQLSTVRQKRQCSTKLRSSLELKAIKCFIDKLEGV